MDCKSLIENGLVNQLEALLNESEYLANTKILWGKNNEIQTDPLHFVSDCVFERKITADKALQIAKLLIANGAEINGSEGSETPLIGAVSLSVESVADFLIQKGARINAISVHGASALHWAAYTGLDSIVENLLNAGAILDRKCKDFQATALFWAIQGYHKNKSVPEESFIRVAQILVNFGADIYAQNFEGISVYEWAQKSNNKALLSTLALGDSKAPHNQSK